MLLAGCGADAVTAQPTLDGQPPIVIAHRGASGERPEHTLAGYKLAIDLGADYIEPDLVLTKDGVLIARHENEISETTDVAAHPEFAARKATKTIDGQDVTGWFTEDFTLAELKTLRARERLPKLRSTEYDGQFEIPTFEEILTLLAEVNKDRKKPVGVYPETKHPSYFVSIGLPHEAPLLAVLDRFGYRGRTAPVFTQSFEVGNLMDLRARSDLPLIQLMDGEGGPADRPGTSYAAMTSPAGLKMIAAYADGIGPNKAMVIPRGALGRLGKPTDLVRDAHAAGLKVHPWTFRRENYFLPLDDKGGVNPAGHGDLAGEIAAYLKTGIDGLFSDNPREAVATVRKESGQ
ncbi:glycerophosphodiester phosphodiesterase [Sphingopyxis sp. H038]|nr:glycerophosphodiester phosphodiesterase [Sphingopyxis sp. H012]KTE07578.1 glycerophosphodiester phosphodiesterase [Sphingopyxis sp. H093]KTE12830.1 glycerophosphodiester phosphodiesterase [Sphingopyxis sp. H053]KTE24926.1 glycerophosphodiester phosphodiesterase [Sphingopyxis sp. H080]KTE32018.1 glycerophosphodiester phosphodiesterase [Sphingopyxis sp. H038]KTE39152.1 glycerophosphodiester phosphodiesterase [Sphingopyxis sp. H077]KTE40343.1 glycerophosphodiester phosphodiesterase [Sphingopy